MTAQKKTTSTKKITKKVVAPAATATALEVEAPIDITPIETAPVVEEIAASSVIKDRFGVFTGMLQDLSSQLTAMRGALKTLERDTTREMRSQEKINAKRKRKTTNRKPSGFVKPTLISTELASFLGKPVGTEMARTEVTREINTYIKEHKLQDPTNGRTIIPDAKLKSLLKIKKGDLLTYFNLQKYMSTHFAKATPKEAVVAETTA
jgi:chromatin remodeling complex protein RSC6